MTRRMTPRFQVNLTLDEADADALDRAADAQGQTPTRYLREALRERMARETHETKAQTAQTETKRSSGASDDDTDTNG